MEMFIFINIGLAFFNMLPIPPLDGSKVLQWLLPPEKARWMEENAMIFFVILIVLVFTGVFEYFTYPIIWTIRALISLFGLPAII